jgi:hypothetical protein
MPNLQLTYSVGGCQVLLALRHENKLLTKASAELSGKLAEAEKQMNEFQQKHDIRIHTPSE